MPLSSVFPYNYLLISFSYTRVIPIQLLKDLNALFLLALRECNTPVTFFSLASMQAQMQN